MNIQNEDQPKEFTESLIALAKEYVLEGRWELLAVSVVRPGFILQCREWIGGQDGWGWVDTLGSYYITLVLVKDDAVLDQGTGSGDEEKWIVLRGIYGSGINRIQ